MGAREVLRDLTGAGFSVEVAGDRLLVGPASKLTDDLRAAVRAAKPDLLALLNRPHKLTLAEGDAAHAEPWDEAAIGRFVARVSLFLRRGIDAAHADDLAERLHLRDAQGDDRALCVECRHLAGHGSSAWRCGNADVAGIGRDLPDALVTQPQRCPGFRDAVR
jgi:hypothetical protein